MRTGLVGLFCLFLLLACGYEYPPSSENELLNIQTVNFGTGPNPSYFNQIGQEIHQVIQKHNKEWHVQLQVLETEGSLDNIQKIDKGKIQLALANSAITWYACSGKMKDSKLYSVRALINLAPNHGFFVCKKETPIYEFAELKGKRIVLGSGDSQEEWFIGPILAAHEVRGDEIIPLYADHKKSFELLEKGEADAIFYGGAMPLHTFEEVCDRHDLRFIHFNEKALDILLAQYPFFAREIIPANSYCGQEFDFTALRIGYIQLLASVSARDQAVYQFTAALYKELEELSQEGAILEGASLLEAATEDGVQFHSSAIRFYRENKLWEKVSKGSERLIHFDEHWPAAKPVKSKEAQ